MNISRKYVVELNQMLPDAVVEEGSLKFSQTKWGVSLILARSLIGGRVNYHLDWAPKNSRVCDGVFRSIRILPILIVIERLEEFLYFLMCLFLNKMKSSRFL